jgi:sortase A
MRISLFTVLLVAAVLVPTISSSPQEPLVTPAPVAHAKTKEASSIATPVQLAIPSIGLTSPIANVGIDAKGDMAVPSGTTNNVGWYMGGTKPGATGSAVLAAHVFAAFTDLHKVAPGDTIYVTSDTGERLQFTVTKTRLYEVADLSPNELFNRAGGEYLHLITCAGQLTPDRSTYTHRLVVYATLVA